MNWKRIVSAGPLIFALTSLPASAVVYEFNTEFSGSGDDCANNPCATLEVTASGSDVNFVLTANLETGEKITGLYGNQDPYTLGENNTGGTSTIVGFGGTSGATAEADTGEDAFKADGDGNFDWLINIDPNDALLNGDTLTWTIEDTTLASITEALSESSGGESGPFTFALRVQGLGVGNEGSGWFFAVLREPPEEVSEPGMLALFGMLLFALGYVQRRRSRIA